MKSTIGVFYFHKRVSFVSHVFSSLLFILPQSFQYKWKVMMLRCDVQKIVNEGWPASYMTLVSKQDSCHVIEIWLSDWGGWSVRFWGSIMWRKRYMCCISWFQVNGNYIFTPKEYIDLMRTTLEQAKTYLWVT